MVLATAGSHLELSQVAPDPAALEAMLASSMWGDDDLPAEVQAGKLALGATQQLHVLPALLRAGSLMGCWAASDHPDSEVGSTVYCVVLARIAGRSWGVQVQAPRALRANTQSNPQITCPAGFTAHGHRWGGA